MRYRNTFVAISLGRKNNVQPSIVFFETLKNVDLIPKLV